MKLQSIEWNNADFLYMPRKAVTIWYITIWYITIATCL